MTEPVKRIRQCKKCGSLKMEITYDEIEDVLICDCDLCLFQWTEDPLDKTSPLELLGKDEYGNV